MKTITFAILLLFFPLNGFAQKKNNEEQIKLTKSLLELTQAELNIIRESGEEGLFIKSFEMTADQKKEFVHTKYAQALYTGTEYSRKVFGYDTLILDMNECSILVKTALEQSSSDEILRDFALLQYRQMKNISLFDPMPNFTVEIIKLYQSDEPGMAPNKYTRKVEEIAVSLLDSSRESMKTKKVYARAKKNNMDGELGGEEEALLSEDHEMYPLFVKAQKIVIVEGLVEATLLTLPNLKASPISLRLAHIVRNHILVSIKNSIESPSVFTKAVQNELDKKYIRK